MARTDYLLLDEIIITILKYSSSGSFLKSGNYIVVAVVVIYELDSPSPKY